MGARWSQGGEEDVNGVLGKHTKRLCFAGPGGTREPARALPRAAARCERCALCRALPRYMMKQTCPTHIQSSNNTI